MNKHLAFATLVAALGGLPFGFDTAVINGTTTRLETVFAFTEAHYPTWAETLTGVRDLLGHTPEEWGPILATFLKGFAVASALVGTIFGALFISRPSDRFGRKPVLIWMAVFLFVSAAGSALARDCTSFILFRFLGGIGVGGASHAFGMGAVIWVYLSEIFPNRIRAKRQAFASSCLWIFCALITSVFPLAVKMFSPGAPFLFFAICMTGLLLWAVFIMIETKNVPLEEIHNKLGIERT